MEQVVAKLLAEFENGRMTRRQLIHSLAFLVAYRPSPVYATEEGMLKATGVHHLSYTVTNYAATRDFYAALFGMQVRGDNGKQCTLAVGETFIVVREAPTSRPFVDHFALAIEDWSRDAVEAALTRRGLVPKPDGDASFLVKDPAGFDLQISAARRPRA
jgi:catechol 2,3-dioxygenase-like lactoylglutathione lyase family enzyme